LKIQWIAKIGVSRKSLKLLDFRHIHAPTPLPEELGAALASAVLDEYQARRQAMAVSPPTSRPLSDGGEQPTRVYGHSIAPPPEVMPPSPQDKREDQQQRRCDPDPDPDQQLAGGERYGVAIVHLIDVSAHGDWPRFAGLNRNNRLRTRCSFERDARFGLAQDQS
jgi:hypothetical protein